MYYYIFAIFVFVLVCLAMVVQRRLYVESRKPEREDTKKREENLLLLYNNIEDLMDGFEEYTEDVMAQINYEKEQILDVAVEIRQLLGEIQDMRRGVVDQGLIRVQEQLISKDAPKETMPPPDETGKKHQKPQKRDRRSKKRHMVMELFDEGVEPRDIAKELNIGIGEVKLILGLVNKT